MPYVPTNIVSVPSGSFTPGALATLQNAAALINASWNASMEAAYNYNAKIDDITNPTTGWLNLALTPLITGIGTAGTPSVVDPTITIPTEISTASVLSDFTTEEQALIAELAGLWTSFNASHFPNLFTDYDNVTGWVQAAIANPGGGIPIAVQNQITADDHARLTLDANRTTATLMQRLSAMRHPMPAGAAASGQLQIQQNKQNLMAESSRKITMQSIENLKFAVSNGIEMQFKAMSAILDYVKTMALGQDTASKVIGIGIDAQSKLISAVSNYIGAKAEVAKLISSVDEFNISTSLTVAEKNQAATEQMIDEMAKVLMEHSRQLSQQITAGLNNLHTSAGTSYGVNST